jgi:hypothetical protein
MSRPAYGGSRRAEGNPAVTPNLVATMTDPIPPDVPPLPPPLPLPPPPPYPPLSPPAYPPPQPPADAEHLRLLSIFHYVLAGLTALFGCLPCIHLALGIALASGAFPIDTRGQPPPRWAGFIIIGVALFFILWFWALAVLMLLGGRNLSRRSHHGFCFVIACLECLFMPFGTVLGVFTIIVLMRPSVRLLFGLPAPGAAPPVSSA